MCQYVLFFACLFSGAVRCSLQPRSRRAVRTSTRQLYRIRDQKLRAATVEIIVLVIIIFFFLQSLLN